jgi:hypothetical protein
MYLAEGQKRKVMYGFQFIAEHKMQIPQTSPFVMLSLVAMALIQINHDKMVF